MNFAYQIENIGFRYQKKLAVSIDKCNIHAGKITAILGNNGAGKTSLLNLLAFIKRPDTGNILFFDKKIKKELYISLRKNIGYVQQSPYLFNYTVIENIELPLKLRNIRKNIRKKRAMQVMEQLEITNLAKKNAHELSGGEIQKTAIACAMVHDPKILIMDEPFTYTDKFFIPRFEKLISKIQTENCKTIIFTTHNQLQAQLFSDHIINLYHGHCIANPISYLNFYTGKMIKEKNIFSTKKIDIKMPEHILNAEYITIDATQIVLSKERLDSSMRNCFKGRIKSLTENNQQIHVVMDAKEQFHIVITKSALEELRLTVGDEAWLSFKSSAININ